uniref:Uncharacterized protein n=1 Tax=Candidatus Kentrum sp. TC TaxID=2126339 RepID=A0A450ZXX5_9GAMM|nr:MAG: hypothetical protein BECKTC1821F_GA0114240_102521 [Candidatus Kentron sp. TC]
MPEILALGPEILEIDEQILALADIYQERNILTPKFYDDGVHIASASVAEIDVRLGKAGVRYYYHRRQRRYYRPERSSGRE